MIDDFERPTSLHAGPLFNEPVPNNGYLWFYIDAFSDCGEYALTIIVFIGSVFSPFYAKARLRASESQDGVNPMQHCAINIALYKTADGKKANRHANQWAMTECSAADGQVEVDVTRLKVSNTTFNWDGEKLTIDIDEMNIPFPAPAFVQAPFAKPLRGKVVVTPSAVFTESFPLDAKQKHFWRPIAPISRVDVDIDDLGLQWQGDAYWDSNKGHEPLEAAFNNWHWSRTKPNVDDASTVVIYDVARVDGSNLVLAKYFSVSPLSWTVADCANPPVAKLNNSQWGIERRTVCDSNAKPSVTKTVEDTPFYARSIVATHLFGEPTTMFHESLSMQRFKARWVQMLLPYKMKKLHCK